MSSEFESAYKLGEESKIISESFNGVDHVLIPEGCTLKSLENLMEKPTRIKCHPEFSEIESFNDYVQSFIEKGSRIFVDESDRRFITVFDFHSRGEPAWGDHSASMKVDLSHEWMRFKSYDGKSLNPIDFAELLEDNIDYISSQGDLTAADLLAMAQNFKIKVKGDVETEETLKGGLKTLIIRDDSTVRGQASDGREICFPEKILFDLRIFHNHETYPISVYLRTRTRQGGLTFSLKIPDYKDIENQAFNKIMENVKTVTSLPTLKGRFAGPSHK